MNTRQDALSWVGNDSTVTTSIFYGGGFTCLGLAVSKGTASGAPVATAVR
jgi:hypothetical protein